jgi:hypothetical protein
MPNSSSPRAGTGPTRARRKFRRFFADGFWDENYIAWERDYKWQAHLRWRSTLDQAEHQRLLRAKAFAEVAGRALKIESRTNLLFAFEKIALRDAVGKRQGAKLFAEGLYDFLYAKGDDDARFDDWCEVVASLPRFQTRVLTWPAVTVFGFIAQPKKHFFMKPMVTRRAATEYGYELAYQSRPDATHYAEILKFARHVRRDLRDLRPRDLIDIQSFLWVQGSDEYEESGKYAR